MAALEHRVATLGHEANRLCEIHADHGEQIKAKQEEIVKYWSGLTTKAKVGVGFSNFYSSIFRVTVFLILQFYRIVNKIWMNPIICIDF